MANPTPATPSRRQGVRRWLVAATIIAAFAGALRVNTQVAPPPVLLIVNSPGANPFGSYLEEVLRAEGLNSFSVATLSSVTSTTLSSAEVVVLAETTLSAAQALLLSNYLAAGGKLVVMRPDPLLLPVLGLAAEATSTTEGYFALDQANSFATGFPSTTLPFHGQARHYTPVVGSETLARLYSNATTATSFPAVVRYQNTVTWTYDLARSVVLTRQGFPANASDRDGVPPYRTTDIFYNAIDRDKVPIPYADVQMRMLTRAILDLLSDVMPLPRLWYFPGTNRTLVVLTGDAHANPQSYYDTEIATVESYGGRISLYVNGGALSASSVASWRSRGHEVGMHPAGFQAGNTLTTAFQTNLTWFTSALGVSPSATTRTHQIEWQGWVDAAKVAANFGIALDTSFYTWGPTVTYPDGHQAHGYINGSAQPMRFVDENGVIVPVYQQVTSLIDEALLVGTLAEHLTPAAATAVSRQIIDNSQAGDYAAVMTQFHVDNFAFGEVLPWATGTMDYARSLNIPMWTAQRWLNYTTARRATTITNLSWADGPRQMSFTVGVPSGSETQSVALPHHFGGFGISGLTVDGAPVTGIQLPITGRATTFVNIAVGSHNVVATYNTPLPTASISVLPTTITQGLSATVSWNTTNATSVTIDQGIGTVGSSGTRTVNPLVSTTYTITATNSAGSGVSSTTLTVIPPPPTVNASVSPGTIAAGDPATLSWSSTNAFTTTIEPGIGAVAGAGTRIVSPPSTTTYTVTVTNTTGTAVATSTLTVNPAPSGSSLRFNGTNQRARFTTLPTQSVFTVEGWVKRTADTGGWETFFSNVDNAYSLGSINMYVDGGNGDCGGSPSDQFAWAYTRVSGGWAIQCSGVAANLNAWHHIAVTRDGANATRIFIDGVLRGTATATGTPTSSSGAFNLGTAGDANSEYFPGFIDEVRISSIARYTATFTPQTARFAPDADTVALYHLDEGTGQTLADASGNNRHGFLGTAVGTEASDPTWSTDIPFIASTAPAITTQPTAQTVISGQTATFTVAAAGTPTPTYQWQVSIGGGAFTNLTNTAPYSGVTNATLTITGVTAPLSGNQYRAVATNSGGSATSNPAGLTVTVAPAITTQPVSQTVIAGQTATVTVAASGTPTPTYQWQVSIGGGPFTNLTNTGPYGGVTLATLTITGATPGLSGNQYRAVATNSAGNATSTAATLTVNVAPTITTPPTNQTIVEGQNGAFTAAASGTPTPTLQWQVSTNGGGLFTNLVNGAPYSGVTAAVLTLTGVTPALQNNQYRLVATNSAGTATSTAATLTVNTAAGAPGFTTQPTNQTVTAGQTAALTVAATGTPAPTLQWQVATGGGPFTNLTETAPYSGVATTTLTITGVPAGLSGNQYRAVATNASGSATSNPATLTVQVAPTITTPPANQTVTAGQTATFTVAATGTPTPSYQWQVSIGGAPFANLLSAAPYSGVTSTTLTITGATPGLSGQQYRVVVTNGIAPDATSPAATLTVNVAPTITTPPTNQTIVAGQNGAFTAAVAGTPTPTLQWQVSINGGGTFTNLAEAAPYGGVATTALTLTGVTPALQNNQYRLVATNSAGTITSTAATLTVNTAPAITTQPTSQTVNTGQTATFVVAATGTPAPAYQWQVSIGGGPFTTLSNIAPYSGVTTATLTITGTTVGLSGNQYRVNVLNTVATITSSTATLTVNPEPPPFSLQFNGSTHRARFTTIPAQTVFTVEGWVKRTADTGGWETVFSNVNSNYSQANVNVYVDGGNADCGSPADQFAWAYTRVGGGWFIQCSGVTAAMNTWYHIAVTRDAANVARIFINGVLRGTATATLAPTSSTGAFNLGDAGDAADEYFPGFIDEVRISSIARYTATFTPQTARYATDADTVALYHLDEGTGQNLADASGNNRHGFLGTAVGTEASDPTWSTDIPFIASTAPAITTQPTAQTVISGQTATFTVAAAGTPTPTYQWQVSIGGGAFTNLTNTAPYSGVTNATLTITGVTAPLSGNQYRAVATNSGGSATSNPAGLTVTVAPAITTQPVSQTVIAGQTATVTVAASGTPTPTYQWQVSIGGGPFTNLTNTGPYGGVTLATLTITGATPGLSGNQYRAVATNSAGNATSTAATLTVNVAPTITTPPTNQTIVEGQNGAFTAAASGTPTPTLQWQVSTNGGGLFTNLVNGAPYSGVTAAVLTLTGVTPALQNNQYRLVATNSAGTATSTAATLTVNTAAGAPGFTTQPTNQTVTAGQTAALTVAATGTPAPTLQWQVATGGGPFTNLTETAPYSGVATTTLTITGVPAGLSGNQYRAVATNASGSATSNPATLTVQVAPTITTPPANQTVTAGQTATFTVAATGTPTPSYQWQVSIGGAPFANLLSAAPYSGVTSTTLTITGATPGLSGQQYRVVVTNGIAPDATSPAATLTVNVAPTIATPPTNQTIVAGQTGAFTAAVAGTPTPTLQWQVSTNGGGTFTNLAEAAPYGGVTTTALTLTGVTPALQNNQYRLVATNSAGTIASTPATLTVHTAPAITTQPTSQTVNTGQTAIFVVAATGTPAPAYQWQVSIGGGPFTTLSNTAPYSGVTSATLTITGTTVGLSGNQYRVNVLNTVATVTSNTVTLTVNVPPPGASLAFNGTSQFARFTTLPAMTVFTVEGWVKRTSDTGRYETFLANANGGYNQETVGVYVDGGNADCGSGDQFAWAYTGPGGWFFQCSGVTAALNTWYHIAVTRDAANATRIFINGVLRNTMTGTPAPLTSTGAFAIGTAGDALAEFFPGLLDEVRISSVVRYTASFTPQTTAFTADANTIALYHLDEGTGQTLTDASGNNRNGVLGSSSAVEAADATRSTDSPVQ